MFVKLMEKVCPPVMTLPIPVTENVFPERVQPTFEVEPPDVIEHEELVNGWICDGKTTIILARASKSAV